MTAGLHADALRTLTGWAAPDDQQGLLRSAYVEHLRTHDDGMLRAGPYPPSVRARIASRTGHLSNAACAGLVRDVVHANLTHVVLAHLSENCNDHGLAHATTASALRRTRFRGRLSVAMQHDVVGPFLPRPSRAEAEAQYTLSL